MKRLFVLIIAASLCFSLGCRGYRHTLCVSADAPILLEVTGGKRTTLKVEYHLQDAPLQAQQ